MDRSRYRPLYLGALALGISLISAGSLLDFFPAPIALGALLLFLTALVASPVVFSVVD